MIRRLTVLLLILLLAFSLSAGTISFKGGESKLSLKEGNESVILSKGAYVKADTLAISSDKITLSGKDWRYITCEGKTSITDEKRGIEITTSYIWYDRVEELLIISAWFEIDDTIQELYAQGGSLRYDMKNELLELGMQIQLLKNSDNSLMRCVSEAVIYDRAEEKVSLKGSAKVSWKGDDYEAEVISIDMKTDTIQLGGRIKGTING